MNTPKKCLLYWALWMLSSTVFIVFAYIFLYFSSYDTYYSSKISAGYRAIADVDPYLNNSRDEHVHRDDDRSIADELSRKVRVLCWVMTRPATHMTRAIHVKATWGKRCNKLLFMSTQKDDFLPTVSLPIYEGRNYLWAKTKAAFRYVYEHHRREADWFLKTDDDTYVIVENLRYMLANYDPKDSISFGCRLKLAKTQVYHYFHKDFMNGGAGYVLSRRALDIFINKGLPSPHLCDPDDLGWPDFALGMCLHKIGVKAIDSRDDQQRSRFFPYNPIDYVFPRSSFKDVWYWNNMAPFYDPAIEGFNCCSKHAISFHSMTNRDMYVFDYFLYQLRAYGMDLDDEDLLDIHNNYTQNKTTNVTLVKNLV